MAASSTSATSMPAMPGENSQDPVLERRTGPLQYLNSMNVEQQVLSDKGITVYEFNDFRSTRRLEGRFPEGFAPEEDSFVPRFYIDRNEIREGVVEMCRSTELEHFYLFLYRSWSTVYHFFASHQGGSVYEAYESDRHPDIPRFEDSSNQFTLISIEKVIEKTVKSNRGESLPVIKSYCGIGARVPGAPFVSLVEPFAEPEEPTTPDMNAKVNEMIQALGGQSGVVVKGRGPPHARIFQAVFSIESEGLSGEFTGEGVTKKKAVIDAKKLALKRLELIAG